MISVQAAGFQAGQNGNRINLPLNGAQTVAEQRQVALPDVSRPAESDIILVAKAFPARMPCRARQTRPDLRARRAARPQSAPLAGKRPRAAEPGAAVGHHDGKRVTVRPQALT
jgi:hypothetical protein